MCSVDWCRLHPEGTVGEFNTYWDNINNELLKVRLTCYLVRLNAHTFHTHPQEYEEKEKAKEAETRVSATP
jgi:hypothetical protein